MWSMFVVVFRNVIVNSIRYCPPLGDCQYGQSGDHGPDAPGIYSSACASQDHHSCQARTRPTQLCLSSVRALLLLLLLVARTRTIIPQLPFVVVVVVVVVVVAILNDVVYYSVIDCCKRIWTRAPSP